MLKTSNSNSSWQQATTLILIATLAATFLLRKGLGIGFFLLCLMGVIAITHRRHERTPLPQAARHWLWALLIFCGAQTLLKLIHHAPLKQYDTLSRYLLASLMVFTFSRWKINNKAYSIAAFLAAACAFAACAYPKFVQHIPFGAYGHTMQILFSNICISFGVLNLFAVHLHPNYKPYQILAYFGAALGILSAILGEGRGSWLAIPVIYLVFLFSIEPAKRQRTALISMTLIIIAAVALYSIPQTGIADRIHNLFNDFSQYSAGNAATSQGMRLKMWQCGLVHMYPQHPWLGWGSIELVQQLHELATEGSCLSDLVQFSHLHNDYIDSLVRYGLIGELIFLAFHLYPLGVYWRALRQPLNYSQRAYTFTGIAISLAALIGSLSNTNFNHNIITLNYLLIQTLLLCQINRLPYPLRHEV